MTTRHLVLALLAALAAGCAAQTQQTSPVDYVLIQASPLGEARPSEVYVQAHLVDTDDPEVHRLLAQTGDADGEVFAALRSSPETRIIAMPRSLALADQDASIFVGEHVRFAQTVAETSADGEVTFRIHEHPRSPQFTGYQLFLTPATPTRGEPLVVSLRF